MLRMPSEYRLRYALATSHPFGIHHTEHHLRPTAAWTYSRRKAVYRTLLCGVPAGAWTIWYPDDTEQGVLLDGRQRYAATRRLFGLPTDPRIAKPTGQELYKVQFNVFTRNFREVPADQPSGGFDPYPDRRHPWIDTAPMLWLSDDEFIEQYVVMAQSGAATRRSTQLHDAAHSIHKLRSVASVRQLVSYLCEATTPGEALRMTKVLNERPKRTVLKS